MHITPNLKQTKRSKPIPSALCKAPVGIVVIKPQPKTLPQPLQTLLPMLPIVTDPVQRPEHLRPLSAVRVPVARLNDRRPKDEPKFIAKKKPPPRVFTTEELELLIVGILALLERRWPRHTFMVRFYKGFCKQYRICEIKAALKLLITSGKVSKIQPGVLQPTGGYWPEYFLVTPPVKQGWTRVWTPPASIDGGWTTQL